MHQPLIHARQRQEVDPGDQFQGKWKAILVFIDSQYFQIVKM